ENSTEFSLRSPRSLASAAACVDVCDALDGLLPNRSPSSSVPRDDEPADAAANRSPGSLRTVPDSSLPNIDDTAAAPRPAAEVVDAVARNDANASTCESGNQSAKPSRHAYVSASISPALKRCCTSAAVIGPTWSWLITTCH